MADSHVPSRRSRETPVEDVDVHRAACMADAGAILLDVREDDEWAAGHIPGAFHVPLAAVVGADLSLFAERQVAVICRSGRRSEKAAAELATRGVRVVNVTNGMIAWAAAGLPVVTAADAGT